MTDTVHGIHHVTVLASDPQATLKFYTDVLGLRFIKQTVHFDDYSTYHFYFGDETGNPGTIMTFFPFANLPPGQVGRGQVSATAFVIPDDSVNYWVDRLEDHDVDFDEPATRFDETVIRFRDHDGQPLELITGESDIEPWMDGPVPNEHATQGFHGVTVKPNDPVATGEVLETLGYEEIAQEDTPQSGDWQRYSVSGDRAQYVDVEYDPNVPPGTWGTGVVHHVAFRTPDDDTQQQWRDTLLDTGLATTSMKDREYFHSVYFREPSGINFEIATDPPGFTHDEEVTELGDELKLPQWLEGDRELIESQLPELQVNGAAAR